MLTALRRWYHTRCIALNRAEITDSLEEQRAALFADDTHTYTALSHWIDDCERSIRYHEMRLNQLAPPDNVSQPTNER